MTQPSRCWTRRSFLKTACAAGIGSVVGTGRQQAEAAAPAGGERVPTRPFGKTGAAVSILSLGGMFDIYNNQLLLKQAVKWGVTYWDTADCYQSGSETGIGRYLARNPGDRGKIFLVSKSDSRDPDGMTRLLDRSLSRLQTPHIDLYLVHGIRNIRELDNTEAWAARAKASGKIRYFGFSTHSNMEQCLMDAPSLGWVDGIMMTYNYRLMHSDRMRAAVASCAAAGIGLTAMKTQGGGQVRTHTETELQLAGRFLQQGFTDGQAKLKAVWDNPHIASICSQMPNLTLLMTNVAAAVDKTRLSGTDNRLFQQLAVETESSYCGGCTDICESAMAQRVPIGDVMRCLMYRRSYAEPDRAVALYRSLSGDARRVLADLDYADAERRCPRKLAIGRLMREAVEKFS